MGTQVQQAAPSPMDIHAKSLNHAQVAWFIARLEKLKPGTKPAWGRMTSEELVPHLIAAVRLSMGEIPVLPFMGNWVTSKLIWPIVRTGWVPTPKNFSIKGKDGKPMRAIQSPGNLSTLATVFDEFLSRKDAGTLKTAPHPLFGDVGAGGWAVLHTLHMKHHLKQFGL